jgi:hypothetical protein
MNADPRNRVRCLTIAFTLVMVAIPARAQSADGKQSARQLSTEGAKAMAEGRHADAVNAFRKAYEQHQDPRYQFNVGVALKALGRHAEALEAFDLFVSEARDVPPEFHAEAERQKSELTGKVGELHVTCTEDGAELLVNSAPRAFTPLTGPLRLDPGRHVVRLERKGFVARQTAVTIVAGKSVHLQIALEAEGTLTVPPPVVATTVPTVVPEPIVTARAADPEPANEDLGLDLALALGMQLWLGGVPGEGADPSVGFGLGAGYKVWQGDALALSLGADVGMAFMTENEKRITFTSLLAGPTLRWQATGPLSFTGRLGVGAVLISGIEPGSALVAAEATEITGTLGALEVRPAMGVEYRLAQPFAIFAELAASVSPRPDPLFRESTIVRASMATGARVLF